MSLQTEKPEEPTLVMKFEIRDSIISYLNNSSAFLEADKCLSTGVKNKLKTDLEKLILSLYDLPFNENHQKTNSISIESTESTELVSLIKIDQRNNIISRLIENKDFLFSATVTFNSKQDLIKLNKEIMMSLINLPSRFVQFDADVRNKDEDRIIITEELINEPTKSIFQKAVFNLNLIVFSLFISHRENQ